MPLSETQIAESLDRSWFGREGRGPARGLAAALLNVLIKEVPNGDSITRRQIDMLVRNDHLIDKLEKYIAASKEAGIENSSGIAVVRILSTESGRVILKEALRRSEVEEQILEFYRNWCMSGE